MALTVIRIWYHSDFGIEAQFPPDPLLLLASGALDSFEKTKLLKTGIRNGLLLDSEHKRVADGL